jgi:hypothetical protein
VNSEMQAKDLEDLVADAMINMATIALHNFWTTLNGQVSNMQRRLVYQFV